jgi:hypothetical protein
MPLRSFIDRDGEQWRVWSVTPDPHAATTLDAEYRDGWLCFERMDGGELRRLALSEVPAAWEALSDERLDLLRRVAPLSAPPMLDSTAGAIDGHERLEGAARARRSGPKSAIGIDDLLV